MRRQAAHRLAGGLVCIAASAGVAGATPEIAAPPAGPALAPRTHGFMLYLTQPIGGRGGGTLRPKFGFRIEQQRMMANSGAPDAGDPLQHRALVGWQMDGLRGMHASDMKVEFGDRITYDVKHAVFAAQSARTTVAPGGPRSTVVNRTDTYKYTELKPDAFRQTAESASMMHDIAAAAIGTLEHRQLQTHPRDENAYRSDRHDP
jgi:hypothetical protein